MPPTKRSELRIAAKIFDPFGFLSTFTINVKSFFQQLCVEKVGWDTELQGKDKTKFHNIVGEIPSFQSIFLSRFLFKKDKPVKNVQLHGFSDASEQAYAAVVYLRVEYLSGEIDVRFLSSKSKVCPLKQQSVPRLELLGACLLAKLVESV